jgi:heme-degrading monooxygenase HmoA
VILEHALLSVKPDEQDAFETAFALATDIIAAVPGFRNLTLSRSLERESGYLLLVEWDRLEDHTEGFRGSDQYEKWRDLLHHFYDPVPVVDHYARVQTAGPADRPIT